MASLLRDCSNRYEVNATKIFQTGTGCISGSDLIYCNDSRSSEEEVFAQAGIISEIFQRDSGSITTSHDPQSGKTTETRKSWKSPLRVTAVYNPPKDDSRNEDEENLFQGRLIRDLTKVISDSTQGDSYGWAQIRDQVFVIGHGNGSELLYKSLPMLDEEVRKCVTVYSLSGTKEIPENYADKVIHFGSNGCSFDALKEILKTLPEQMEKSVEERRKSIKD